MITAKKLFMILLPISLMMLGFSVGTAKATTESFVIRPNQGVVENLDLYGSAHVDGNVLVSNGSIDFFIYDPDGAIIQQSLNVSNAPINFTTDKNGNYSMCMNNTYEPFNVTVELDYGCEFSYTVSDTVQPSSSVLTAIVGPPLPVTRPPDQLPNDDNGSDYVVEPYLTFQGAKQMLGQIDSTSAFMPFRSVNLTDCVASVMAFVGIASIEFCERKRHPIIYPIKQGNFQVAVRGNSG